jgi:hypothetical protein
VSAAAVRRVLGIVLLVVGVVAGVAMWLGAGRRYDDAIAKLAPAPIGCNTTLVFDETGTYTFFVETKGQIGPIDGDCASDARSYDVDGVPRVTLTLADSDGDNVDLDRTSGPTYDRDGKRGTGVRSVDIDRTGSYVLAATADDTDAVIRVGRDPAAGVTALRVGAIVSLIVGVVGGVLLLVLRPRQRRVLPTPTTQPPWPTGLPTQPPLGPPAANPPVPPPYAPRPPSVRPPGQPAGQPPWYQPPSRPAGAPGAEPPASAWPPPAPPERTPR